MIPPLRRPSSFVSYKEAAACIQTLLADAPIRLDDDFRSYLQLK